MDRFTTVEAAGGGQSPETGEGRFSRDGSFDLPAFWAERAAQFARSILREEVVLRLSARGVRQLPYVTERAAAREAIDAAQAAGGPDAHGRLTVTLPVESADIAYAQLLALGPEGEVLAPSGLRERFAAAARRTAALYTEPGGRGAGPSGGSGPDRP